MHGWTNFMNFRKAALQDIPQILSVYESVKLDRTRLGNAEYETRIQKEGFLLGSDDAETYKKLISEAPSFLVAEEDGKIVGYIIADHREKFYDDEYKTWFDLKLKEIYYNSPKAMTIATVAVDPGYGRRGLATTLLKKLKKELKSQGFKHLYSIITLAPVTNCPTVLWHAKNDFKKIAMGRPRERLFDLEWYVGVLLYREI